MSSSLLRAKAVNVSDVRLLPMKVPSMPPVAEVDPVGRFAQKAEVFTKLSGINRRSVIQIDMYASFLR